MTFTPVLLPRSLKNCHPFRLGTTSFIYPAGYAENVKLLGPYIDAVEVLAFESRWPDSLPSEADIAELVRLGEEHDLCYNRITSYNVCYTKLLRSRISAAFFRDVVSGAHRETSIGKWIL